MAAHPDQRAELRAFVERACAPGSPLKRYLRSRCTSQADADDAFQEVVARLFIRAQTAPIEDFDSFAMRIARNLVVDAFRRSRSHESVEDDLADDLPSAAESYEAKTALERLGKAMGELPERQRAAFALRRLDGMPLREIAQRLGVSLATVERDIATALKNLRRAVRSHRDDGGGDEG